ncbi:MAG TPA: type II secretion system F family protein [Anaerolineaceae bacterium]|nr:type II secretion system F family protein [Anaerolineaceae bacterium]HOD44262.1 type II secretion system F family protein [Anaerolineaceae bacterium]HOH19425.1 type II secretion system F family protein [Anaerolineaceae bacterium]HPA32215.1 type II secretion system F family protein [Anaerolineaceae bacterium]HQH34184.1 type II secretion system F family protein [Anaerolineaceae bacterium]
MDILLIVIIVAIIAFAIILTVIGLRSPKTSDERALLDRLEELSQDGEPVDLRKLELSRPFSERVILPVARKLGEIATKFTPANALQSIQRKLELAGSPANLDPSMVLVGQFVLMFVLAGVIVLAFTLGTADWPTSRIVLVAVLAGLMGFAMPQMLLTSKIQRRQNEIRKAMPDALDLLTICVEAGLGFEAALQKVCEKWENELSLAFARVLREIQLGKLRKEALRDMADRIGLTELTSFTAAVIQSEQLGVSLAKILRIQSDQMRIRRRQIAEEKAHKAPVKMLIPMALLIFPTIMIVLLTPAVLRLMQSALGEMFTK